MNDAVPKCASMCATEGAWGGRYHLYFIGRAGCLTYGLAERKKLVRDKRLDASLLFVHEPVLFDGVSCAEAVERLVKRYRPRPFA